MENKSVIKKIFKDNNIIVLNGIEVNLLYEVLNIIKDFVYKLIVIKLKLINFGIGISIFLEGVDEDSII